MLTTILIHLAGIWVVASVAFLMGVYFDDVLGELPKGTRAGWPLRISAVLLLPVLLLGFPLFIWDRTFKDHMEMIGDCCVMAFTGRMR